jgi:hypothetical protein
MKGGDVFDHIDSDISFLLESKFGVGWTRTRGTAHGRTVHGIHSDNTQHIHSYHYAHTSPFIELTNLERQNLFFQLESG